MQIRGNLVIIILFAAFVASLIAANVVGYMILGEVNGRRAPQDQYPFVLTPTFKVWAEHEREFPESRLRLYHIILFLFGVTCGFTAFWGAVTGLF